jgi:signal transduction histidine kinase
VEVIDRGVGMALPSAATGWNSPLGIGIAGMRERVKQLGGVFEIQSEPGHGTTIRVEFPVGEGSQAIAEKKEELPRFESSVLSAKTARAARAGS